MAGQASNRRGSEDAPDVLGALLLVGMALGGGAGFWLALETGSGGVAGPVLLILGGLIAGTVAGEVAGVAIDSRHERARRPPSIPREELRPEPALDLEDAARLCGYDPDSERPLGWYPDPAGVHAMRLWDGRRWTAHGWSPRDQRAAGRRPPRRGPAPDQITRRVRRAA